MKKIYSLLTILFLASLFFRAEAQTVTIVLRPGHVDISDAASRGAVLVNLSGYSTDDVRYRLYQGGNQYDCWDESLGDYVTVNSYSSGPRALGTPTTSSTFWIPYLRATNNSTVASYRDRLGPTYPSNFNTRALPAATAISSPFELSGTLDGSSLAEKYVTLAFAGNDLIAASHSDLSSGDFTIVCPEGITITRVEVRNLLNGIVGEKAGNWEATANTGSIQITAPANVDLADLKVDGVTIEGFAADKTVYLLNLDPGTVIVPVVTATASDTEADVSITPATSLVGDRNARTTTVVVTGSDGNRTKTYSIQFDPLLVFDNIRDLKLVTEYDRLHQLSSQAILTARKFESARNTYFIQDNTAGIRIDDPSKLITTSYDIGDGISGLTGTFTLYGGMLQFVPAADPGPRTATGLAPEPELITVAGLKANVSEYEARLIMLEDIVFNTSGNFGATAANFTVNQGEETLTLRTEFPADLSGKAIPEIANVVGVVIVFNNVPQIAPRMYSDFSRATDIAAAVEDNIRIYPVPVTAVLNLEGVESFSTVEIRDITGKLISTVNNRGAGVLSLDTSSLPPGVYLLRLDSQAGQVIRRFIKN